MTTPTEPPPSNPPNAQPPHVPTHTERPPVVVQAQGADSGLAEQVRAMGTTLAGMPESIVHAFREATQPQTLPQQAATPPAQQPPNAGGSGALAPGSAPPSQTAAGDSKPRGTKFARWFFGAGS